ncbi:histidine--tRNA ligase [Ureaplasma sp. ES3154-GEN]|uniref:histidine--tRNA ligase n=1 Tax=Ureaplasma sp. ES3154-GEN TaxID=2984844 RepID=UPI0021E88413|nr:histidine--tRNA ligase [Ureaplasma sp. ES3154-GEN]MCV3743654.1 histidine--tRNA ligase [Ureaplasma sp. ES3154-GEN]
MSQTINRIRGTVDLYGQELDAFRNLEQKLLNLANIYGYNQIKTPVFEHYELFNRSSGETSDLVSKEMYVFQDKGERWIALRPEGTAPALRAVIENKLLFQNVLPLKIAYFEPCFRYERPQSGRQRQFHQFGVELLGSNSIYTDFEIISFANQILKDLKINKYRLEINYISTPKKRATWINALQKYFANYLNELEPVSRERLNINPLRILDDKIESKKDFVQNAPKIDSFWDEDEKKEFAFLCSLLDAKNIKYDINLNLVRGLDYYTGVVFEFISTSDLLVGQSTVIGGGRYMKLLSELNGPDYNGIGFGCGVERILIALKDVEQQNEPTYLSDYLIGYTDSSFAECAHLLASSFRASHLKTDVLYEVSKFDKIFKRAKKTKPKQIIIFAEKEWQNNHNVIVVNEADQTQQIKNFEELLNQGANNENK